MSKTVTRFSIGRVVADHWTELASEDRLDIARGIRESLNRARADHNQVRIKKIVTTKEYVS